MRKLEINEYLFEEGKKVSKKRNYEKWFDKEKLLRR